MRFRKCTFLLIVLVAGSASAIEIGVEARTASLQFPWNQASSYSGTGAYETSISRWFWGGAGWMDIPLGEDFNLHIGYETDPILRNVVTSLFRFDRGIVRVGVGPFFGFLNQDDRLASFGLSTSIQVQWPGKAFISARSDGGLALGLVAGLASVPQTRSDISLGFYTPNAIVSAILSGKRFSQTDAAKKLINDDLTKYALVVDIYKKNVPYQLSTTLGYQLRSKYFESSGLTDSIGSAILGIKFSFEAISGLTFYGEFTNAVFSFGMDNLKGKSPANSDILFEARLGMTWQVDGDYLWDSTKSLLTGKIWAKAADKQEASPAPATTP